MAARRKARTATLMRSPRPWVCCEVLDIETPGVCACRTGGTKDDRHWFARKGGPNVAVRCRTRTPSVRICTLGLSSTDAGTQLLRGNVQTSPRVADGTVRSRPEMSSKLPHKHRWMLLLLSVVVL
ncbi:OapA N-terminal domain-containing protein [Microbacterium wangruii]|uniref:OapA N-terminal domain-containing protein n=1 Tax=Microbacterium wangruii TaxID=3049073 RepID=UPI003306DFE2